MFIQAETLAEVPRPKVFAISVDAHAHSPQSDQQVCSTQERRSLANDVEQSSLEISSITLALFEALNSIRCGAHMKDIKQCRYGDSL
jgi:hypothetical protein